ncbi:MAG: hypothetical protein U9Q71_03345 [Pseudomonadota bacterium]|nr:hypothetical protein [Pseudomonadota bacterium]
MARPTGVTILGVLQLVFSLLMLLGGLAVVFGSGWIVNQLSAHPDAPGESAFVIGFGVVMVVIGLIGTLLARGLLKLKPWAWTATLVLQIVGVLGNVWQLVRAENPAPGLWGGIFMAAVIIYYLYRPAVKQAFGKG